VDKVVVTTRTKTILGVQATVVLDRVTVNGQPSEKTFDWYAQDKRGNVWYLGEAAFDYKNGHWVRASDSWQAGNDGAKAGRHHGGPSESRRRVPAGVLARSRGRRGQGIEPPRLDLGPRWQL
jgi:hypothetical protein